MFCAKINRDIDELLPKMDCVLIGPGLGRSAGTSQVVLSILKCFDKPVVLDADGINLICLHKDILRGRTSQTILTPHEGEFCRLAGNMPVDRVKQAGDLANELGVTVVLKGYNTVITDGAHTYINTTGNPGMAVGGSGDVLAGMITSLIGQGIPPLDAAACGVWLHGAAGGHLCKRDRSVWHAAK